MARIIDKDTRIIDIDFGEITMAAARPAPDVMPLTVTTGGPGVGDLLTYQGSGTNNGGSFIQYQRIDLDYMARNNEVMMPVEVSVQRTSPVPLGYSNNGNNIDQIEEYIYVLTRPLNNQDIANPTFSSATYEDLRRLGLDKTYGPGRLSGNAGWPNQVQTIYAEKRMYSYNSNLGASQANGELWGATHTPPNLQYNTLMGMPSLDSVTTWGSMSAITGPNLHVYRIVINRNQTFPGGVPFKNIDFNGDTSCLWPAVNISFLCKDPNFSEGEYLTRVANAMNNVAEGGPVA